MCPNNLDHKYSVTLLKAQVLMLTGQMWLESTVRFSTHWFHTHDVIVIWSKPHPVMWLLSSFVIPSSTVLQSLFDNTFQLKLPDLWHKISSSVTQIFQLVTQIFQLLWHKYYSPLWHKYSNLATQTVQFCDHQYGKLQPPSSCESSEIYFSPPTAAWKKVNLCDRKDGNPCDIGEPFPSPKYL